jgi:hypothetical protein
MKIFMSIEDPSFAVIAAIAAAGGVSASRATHEVPKTVLVEVKTKPAPAVEDAEDHTEMDVEDEREIEAPKAKRGRPPKARTPSLRPRRS